MFTADIHIYNVLAHLVGWIAAGGKEWDNSCYHFHIPQADGLAYNSLEKGDRRIYGNPLVFRRKDQSY